MGWRPMPCHACCPLSQGTWSRRTSISVCCSLSTASAGGSPATPVHCPGSRPARCPTAQNAGPLVSRSLQLSRVSAGTRRGAASRRVGRRPSDWGLAQTRAPASDTASAAAWTDLCLPAWVCRSRPGRQGGPPAARAASSALAVGLSRLYTPWVSCGTTHRAARKCWWAAAAPPAAAAAAPTATNPTPRCPCCCAACPEL